MGSTLLGGTLGLLELLLKSLDLLLEKSVLVGQRSNLLLLLQVVVLELLDLLVGLVGALLGRLGLSLEGVKFLSLAFGFTMGVYCHAMTRYNDRECHTIANAVDGACRTFIAVGWMAPIMVTRWFDNLVQCWDQTV